MFSMRRRIAISIARKEKDCVSYVNSAALWWDFGSEIDTNFIRRCAHEDPAVVPHVEPSVD